MESLIQPTCGSVPHAHRPVDPSPPLIKARIKPGSSRGKWPGFFTIAGTLGRAGSRRQSHPQDTNSKTTAAPRIVGALMTAREWSLGTSFPSGREASLPHRVLTNAPTAFRGIVGALVTAREWSLSTSFPPAAKHRPQSRSHEPATGKRKSAGPSGTALFEKVTGLSLRPPRRCCLRR